MESDDDVYYVLPDVDNYDLPHIDETDGKFGEEVSLFTDDFMRGVAECKPGK